MSTLTKAVSSADKTRRSKRDEKRAAFFADHELDVFTDPFSLDLDPAAQLSVVMHLLDQSIATHMDETSALRAMRLQLSSLSLGLPTGPVSTAGRPVPAMMKPQSWQFGIFGSESQ